MTSGCPKHSSGDAVGPVDAVGTVDAVGSVDVVVPCYNYARFLPCCVESLLAQGGVHVRILIIDDASTDETADVARALAQREPRITVFVHERNRGSIETFNEGIAWARQEFFLLISADDWLLPGALRRAVAALRANDAVLCGGRAAVAERNKPQPDPSRLPQSDRVDVLSGQAFIENCCSQSAMSPIWTPTAVVRTAVQQALGGYNANLPHAGDLEMWLRFATRGPVVMLDAYQAVYRKHASNMHYSYGLLPTLRQHLLAFDSAFAREGERIANRETLRGLYRKHLAIEAIRGVSHQVDPFDRHAIDAHVAFACELFPEIRTLPVWNRMRVRQMWPWKLARKVKRAVKPVLAS
jgi:glycosyltransferase involved in cell wall biosynthesis